MNGNVSILVNGEEIEVGHNSWVSDVIDYGLSILTQKTGGVAYDNPAAFIKVFQGATALGYFPLLSLPAFGIQNPVDLNYQIPNLDLPGTSIESFQLSSKSDNTGRILASYTLSTPIIKTVFIRVNIKWSLYAYGL